MKPPCDEAVIRSQREIVACHEEQGRWVLVATIVASSMAFIDSTVVNVALPALQNNFGASVVAVQWVVEAYGLTLAALILVGGSMGDLLGRRRIFVLGVALFAAASVACGLAFTIEILIAARAVQGIGAAFLVPGSLALISTSFDESHRGQAIGTWSGSTAITTAIGPVFGGWLIQHVSWRWAFFINVPLAAMVIAISLWRVPESRSERRGPIDWSGTTAVTVCLTGLVFGFIESASLGWRNPLVIGSFAAAAIGGAWFKAVETRSSSPMVPFSLFRSQTFAGANLLTLFLYAAIGIFFFLLPMNLIQVQGYSATAAGGAVLPLILLMFLLSRWSGGLVDRYGARLPLIAGTVVAGLGFLLFAIPSIGGSYWTTFFPAVIMLGLGMSISVAPLTTVVMGAVDQDRVGTASGINNAIARVAGVLSVAVLGAVMVTHFASHLDRDMRNLNVSNVVRGQVNSNATQMAALKPPAAAERREVVEIKSSIFSSFVSGFRLIMFICAALAFVSSAIAWWTIPAHSVSAGKKEKSVKGKPEVEFST
jgi:EmrB/QacA subfamily drug resistance transporter